MNTDWLTREQQYVGTKEMALNMEVSNCWPRGTSAGDPGLQALVIRLCPDALAQKSRAPPFHHEPEACLVGGLQRPPEASDKRKRQTDSLPAA